jgi:hypothetical protein
MHGLLAEQAGFTYAVSPAIPRVDLQKLFLESRPEYAYIQGTILPAAALW